MAGRDQLVGSAVSERRPGFWAFSLSVYEDAGVQTECLDLQDRYGIDVSLLLFCAYVGAVHGAVLSDVEVRQAAELVARWHSDVVKSLREARRALKPFATDASPIMSSAKTLRERVKAIELEAERIEQIMLEEWSAARINACLRAQPSAAVPANIHSLFAAYARPLQPPGLPDRLIAAALAAARSLFK